MSRIKVDEICNFAENGAVEAIEGITIASGKKLTLLVLELLLMLQILELLVKFVGMPIIFMSV